MSLKNALKQIFTRGCVLFTVLSVTMYSASAIFSGKLNGWIPKLDLILMLLIMSFSVCAANLLLKSEKVSSALRIPVHFIVLGIVYYMLFVIWGGFATNGATTLIALILYALIYAVCISVYYMIRGVFKKHDNKKQEYSSVFHPEK